MTHYENHLSDAAKRAKASDIREILKELKTPGMISLAGGIPSPETFSVDLLREIINGLLDQDPERALQYGTTEGHLKTREAIANYMKKHDVRVPPDDILVTAGGQEGIMLLIQTLVNEKDTVITSKPTYVGALISLNVANANVEGIALDYEKGIKVEQVEEKLNELKKNGNPPKFIYLVPTFQNPTGVTISEENRKRLLELASEYDTFLIEDNPYSELRYAGKPVKYMKAMDKENRVIYIGTISKLMVPGLRLGWIIAPHEILEKVVLLKQATDLCTSTLSQAIAAEFMERGGIEKQLEKSIPFYGKRRKAMLEAMDDYLGKIDGVIWTKPGGGMFSWVHYPEKIDTRVMLKKDLERKVAYVPGGAFYPDADVHHTMRLNFTYASEENIREGIKRIAEVAKEELA